MSILKSARIPNFSDEFMDDCEQRVAARDESSGYSRCNVQRKQHGKGKKPFTPKAADKFNYNEVLGSNISKSSEKECLHFSKNMLNMEHRPTLSPRKECIQVSPRIAKTKSMSSAGDDLACHDTDVTNVVSSKNVLDATSDDITPSIPILGMYPHGALCVQKKRNTNRTPQNSGRKTTDTSRHGADLNISSAIPSSSDTYRDFAVDYSNRTEYDHKQREIVDVTVMTVRHVSVQVDMDDCRDYSETIDRNNVNRAIQRSVNSEDVENGITETYYRPVTLRTVRNRKLQVRLTESAAYPANENIHNRSTDVDQLKSRRASSAGCLNEIVRDSPDERYAQRTMTKSLKYAKQRKDGQTNVGLAETSWSVDRAFNADSCPSLTSHASDQSKPQRTSTKGDTTASENLTTSLKKSDIINLAFINPKIVHPAKCDSSDGERVNSAWCEESPKTGNHVDTPQTDLGGFNVKKGRREKTPSLSANSGQLSPEGTSPNHELLEGIKGTGNISETNEEKDNITSVGEKPLWYCQFITKYPVRAFAITSATHLLFVCITLGLFLNGSDIFPTDFEGLPLILHDDITYTRDLAWRLNNDYPNKVRRPMKMDHLIPTWIRGQYKDSLEIIYEDPGGSILTMEHLEQIHAAEEMIFNISEYQTEFCRTQSPLLECAKPTSIMRLFDGTFGHVDAIFNGSRFKNAGEVFSKSYKYNETRYHLVSLLSKDTEFTPCVHSSMARSIFHLGWPPRGAEGEASSSKTNRIKLFLSTVMKPKLEEIISSNLNGINVYYISNLLLEHDASMQAAQDMQLAIGSLVFIFVITWVHTRSFFITGLGVFSILSSFLLTNLIYRYILDFKYFGFFHILSIFIILGIGVDDIFVFTDTWRLFQTRTFPSEAMRLTRCYKLAAKTTFVTSFTTMVAFLVSGISPLLPVKSFGIFTGVLVIVNYISIAIHFPTVLVMHNFLYIKVRNYWNTTLNSCNTSEHASVQSDGVKQTKQRSYFSSKDLFTEFPKQEADEASHDLPKARQTLPDFNCSDSENSQATVGCVVRFLSTYYFSFVRDKRIKLTVPLVFVACTVFLLVKATSLEPDSEQVQLFVASHNYAKAQKRHAHSFTATEFSGLIDVRLIWGMKPADVSQCSTRSTKPKCKGTSRWDSNFDASPAEAQLALHKFCEKLQNLSEKEADALRIRRDPVTNKLQIACFTIPLQEFLKHEENRVLPGTSDNLYPDSIRLDIPLTAGNVTTLMERNPLIYNVATLPTNFDRYFETAIAYWITNRYSLVPTNDFKKYSQLIGEVVDPKMTRSTNIHPGLYYGTRLKYIVIQIKTTMSFYTLTYNDGLAVMNKWESLMENAILEMPDSLKGGFQTTYGIWHWLKVQESLTNSAKLGVALGLILALVVLIIMTWNLLTGFLATLVIAMVTACVIGIIPLAGWKLGVLESLNICLVVGLSVDYVVHIAEAYNMSKRDSREGRVQDALETVAVSVISGAITTFGAAAFMLFAKIQFLYEFGIFVMSIVGISLAFSLLCFTTVLCLCGPEGLYGSLTPMFRLCHYVCCCSKLGRRLTCGRRCQFFCAATLTCEIPSDERTVVILTDRRVRNYEL